MEILIDALEARAIGKLRGSFRSLIKQINSHAHNLRYVNNLSLHAVINLN